MLQHRTKERIKEVILFTLTIFVFIAKPIISKAQTLNDPYDFKEVAVQEEKKKKTVRY